MITPKQGRTLLGSKVHDRDGTPVGRVAEVYTPGADQPPAWLLVMDDSVPARTHIAPCEGAELTGAGVRLAVDRHTVEGAPALTRPPNEPITEADEARLVEYYTGSRGAMTRSEERARVATTTEVTGRVRVRRYIETENVQITVPVRRERISIERLPPAGTESPSHEVAASDGPVEEIVLHEERVVIVKEIVPTERVRLWRDVVTEDVTVETPLRRERIELHQPGRDPQPLD